MRRRGWCVDGEHRGSAALLRRLALLVADALAPVTSAAITLLVTIPQEILGLSGCSTRSPVVCDDDLLQGREAIFLSRLVMVRHNRADEKRTDIHERYSLSTSASIALSYAIVSALAAEGGWVGSW